MVRCRARVWSQQIVWSHRCNRGKHYSLIGVVSADPQSIHLCVWRRELPRSLFNVYCRSCIINIPRALWPSFLPMSIATPTRQALRFLCTPFPRVLRPKITSQSRKYTKTHRTNMDTNSRNHPFFNYTSGRWLQVPSIPGT